MTGEPVTLNLDDYDARQLVKFLELRTPIIEQTKDPPDEDSLAETHGKILAQRPDLYCIRTDEA